MRSTCRVLRFYFVCYFTGCCEEGFEQPVPAVLRPGGQKQSCGLFLGRGSANPSWPTNAQHLPGAAFFVLHGRAGVHARRKTSGTARSRFGMVFASHGRAGDFARRTDDFSNFKNNNVGRGQDPALQIVVYGRFPRKPRAMAHPCREAYMPPLQTSGTAYTARSRSARCLSRIVGAAYMPPAKRCPRRPFMGCAVFISHCRARETGNEPGTPRRAHPCREACMPPLQTPGIASMTPGTGGGGRFTGRIHAAPTNRPGTAGK